MSGSTQFDISGISEIAGSIAAEDPDFSIIKTGNGTLILSADNTYSGATTVADGTLQLGNGGTTGSVMGSDARSHCLVT